MERSLDALLEENNAGRVMVMVRVRVRVISRAPLFTPRVFLIPFSPPQYFSPLSHPRLFLTPFSPPGYFSPLSHPQSIAHPFIHPQGISHPFLTPRVLFQHVLPGAGHGLL